MRRKFPNISFGLLTVDCKDNPDADVLIMTTEILRNTLFNKKINKQNINEENKLLPLSFDLDIDNELAGVIFDEVHYINDPERGSVWEQCLLLLPPHIQLILLSATIDKPESFAEWIEINKNKQNLELNLPEKKMYLASTNHRVVPLKHHMWINCHNWLLKDNKNQDMNSLLKKYVNKPITILESNKFNEQNHIVINKLIAYMKDKGDFLKREFILNGLVYYLKKEKLLPAITFIFSRKNVELAAKEIGFSLFDSETEKELPSRIEKECRHILSSKLLNYKEFLELPEYKNLISLLQKGVAIHHAGMITILREIVELLFEKGYIKLLFATETFAVGLNMPTKTVIFTGLSKFNGEIMRSLYSHEYTQMAGRAGRRGLDTIGHIFHCNNLFEFPELNAYKKMLTGPPQKLESKFKISFSLGLNVVASGGTNEDAIRKFVNCSLLNTDIQKEVEYYLTETNKVVSSINAKKKTLELCKTPNDVITTYNNLVEKMQHSKQKQIQEIKRKINNLKDNYPNLESDIKHFDAIVQLQMEIDSNMRHNDYASTYIQTNVNKILQLLIEEKFIQKDNTTSENDEQNKNNLSLSEMGLVASQIQEAHPLVLAKIAIESNYFKDFSSSQLAALFSCFIQISLPEDKKMHASKCEDELICKFSNEIKNNLILFEKIELSHEINTGSSYLICFDLQNEILKWCEASNEDECKLVINDINNKNIFTGEFIKAILKINNIADEFQKICETINHVELLEKVTNISNLTLKYIITNQSLYI